ncbi:replication-associated recombination protein A [Geopsychrobacter electrodiphilus]|uniref:replication-associated recombination protein A n=1 Tax=Geopsychrobacter electrodiphilus TaxID=225196 RepID=UPI00037FBF2C|nr:replication-associated recombination protein A [Geopsychrobacter electrodiphilus]
MSDLFNQEQDQSRDRPLAERMRPRSLAEVVGQQHLLAKGKLLRKLIETDQLGSLIFWGPPGTGKTSLGQVIANTTRSRFVFFSAVLGSIKDVREILTEAKHQRAYYSRRTLLFVDEIHRFNKAQQDAFLPAVEKGEITLIGATTENPSFEVNSALLSRSRVFVLEPLDPPAIKLLIQRALSEERGLAANNLQIAEDALEFLADQAAGDARVALGALEVAAAATTGTTIDLTLAQESLQKKALLYDKGAEEHYNVISAFIKSMRGSDPDAALYWLARMIEAGEDPLFIVRRMVIFASEDIGNADPRALQLAMAVQQAVHFVGLPEARINLAQGVTYLATAPKSNASYVGIKQAQAEVRNSGSLPVPKHIRNAPTSLMKELDYGKGYKYAHDHLGGVAAQQHLPEKLQGTVFYRPTDRGYEKLIGERMAFIRNQFEATQEKPR